AAGLAAAELVVGLVRGSASPVVPVGQEVIDRIPSSVREWAIETFGTADKAVLVLGSLIVLAVVGSIVGILTVRGHRSQAFTVALFTGLIGVLAVLQRPAPSIGKMAPAVIGTVVSIAVLWWLSERFVTAPARSDATHAETMGLNRRGFLYGSVVVGSASVITGGMGRLLQRRFEIDDERSEISLPEPSSSGSNAGEFDFGIDGISPFVTSVDEFYRIDTAIVVPQVSKDSWSLKIGGMVDQEIELTFDDLLAREQVERYVTLSCVSNPVGGDLVGNGIWQGVMLADVLREAGIQAGAEQLVSRSIDGWTCGTPVAAVMDGRDAMLAIGQNGQPLRAEHGYPVRMVVPGLYGYVSATKWVTEIELTTWDAFDAYWVPRGWAKEAPVKTLTRIDLPRHNSKSTAGPLEIGGVAWAVHRGISAVQVRVDGGEWVDGELAGVPSDDTWRQWRYTWDATPGEHVIEARAADGAGVLQEEEEMSPAPNGAQGYHQIRVEVG
ncbi:MAG TPA: molybdopterin-dependent oxidoreductase, partial [Ilumatobacteraceae bacterium]|nr:molybdopterin-dependent oxidoreductase [Ilumatobacteraceae bacterium]